jgi:LmbE family N-acetylglucosaminyl deacetylase
MTLRAFAIAAHPDDIEFMMSGTLILLRRAGYEIHYMTVANGSCGTDKLDEASIVRIRREEALQAAASIGAVYHESLVPDIGIFYEASTLGRLGAVIREVSPEIILTQGHWEYMEDHSNTCRLVLSAAFTRGMQNFGTEPPRAAIEQEVTVYHALPYGLRDPLRRRVQPGMYVDVSEVVSLKRRMLALHKSQKEWLDASQGIDSYLTAMEDMCAEVGQMSGRFQYAEGWTRHLHLGYCAPDADPLLAALMDRCFVNGAFEKGLG